MLLGALPYLIGKCGLSCEVYATIPVYQMGQMFTYDYYQSRHNNEDFDLFTLDDVDTAFEKVIQVKYNQTITFKGKGQGFTVTPLPAGHMLGGTIWRIVKDGGEDVVYAVDFNHKKERHLNGCVLEKISRPSLLITDCLNVKYIPERRSKRDDQLKNCILETVRSGGNVLISVDTAGRVLELSNMLEHMWRAESGLQAYSLVLLNSFSYNVIEFAKSLVEWMSDKLMRTFEGQRNNPFSFRFLQLCHNLTELNHVMEPKIILASQPDMECGFSRELFFSMANNPKNTIILTQRPLPGTLSDSLMKFLKAEKPFVLNLIKKMRVPLTGQELEEYLEQKRAQELEKERQNQDSNINHSMKDEDESEESDDDYFDSEFNVKDESKTKATNLDTDQAGTMNIIKHDLMMPSRMDGRVKGGGFFKNAKKSYPMFPSVEHKIKWDEYGEIINGEDYAIFDMSRMHMEDKENKDFNNGDPLANEVEMINEKSETNPTKCIENNVEINVDARIEFIDFEGRSDGESLKKIITLIKPRRLILVRGLEDNLKYLSTFCTSTDCVSSGRIFTPQILEMVDATTERHIYQLRLRDALVSSLKFSQSKDGAQLAWVEAEILMTNPESLLPQIEDVEQQQQQQQSTETTANEDNSKMRLSIDSLDGQRSGRELMPTLQQLPLSKLSPHQTIFVNELKLSDFKQVLKRHGIQAEFSGGVLLCNGLVEVKRTESGRIHLEGTLCDDYFKIRQLLYQQYAVL